MKDATDFEKKTFTRAYKNNRNQISIESAITNHAVNTYHSIKREHSRSLAREDDSFRRSIRKSIHIQRARRNSMNCDE